MSILNKKGKKIKYNAIQCPLSRPLKVHPISKFSAFVNPIRLNKWLDRASFILKNKTKQIFKVRGWKMTAKDDYRKKTQKKMREQDGKNEIFLVIRFNLN